MKKILITGTNGYLGKSLLNNLKSYEVTALNRSVCDLTDADSVRDFLADKYFDVVIHCAVIGGSRLGKEDRKVFKDNLRMFENLSFGKQHYGKLIHFGSGAQFVYPLTNYGHSKKIIADMIEETENFYNLIIWGLFDENELNTRFIKSNVKRCIEDNPMVIHKDKYMDFVHMKDLIKLVEWYVNNDNCKKSFECKYKETYRLTHIAEMIAMILGKTAKVEVTEDGLDNPYISNSKSFISGNFEDRLKETIEELK